MSSPFCQILRAAVEATPGALGGAFAARDGETVDAFASPFADERQDDPDGWAILTAHYGVLLAHIQSALHTFHYGEAELVLLAHDEVDILVQPVGEGYYALLAVAHPTPLARAITHLADAARALREEM